MNGRCTGCAILWLLGLRKLYCWRRRRSALCAGICRSPYCRMAVPDPLELIITGCQSSEGQNGQTPFLLAEMLGWPCFTQVERFTLDAPFITLEQRTENGLRCCRVRLPAVIAVRRVVKWPCQYRECASKWLRGKQQLSVKLLLPNRQRCSVGNWQEQSNDAERR